MEEKDITRTEEYDTGYSAEEEAESAGADPAAEGSVSYDLNDLPVNSEEKTFFDDTDFQDYDQDRNEQGKGLPLTSFILSIGSLLFLIPRLLEGVLVVALIAMILGIIAVVRKHREIGFAWSGIMISAIVIVLISWVYIDYRLIFEPKVNKSKNDKFVIEDDETASSGNMAELTIPGFIVEGGGI
ncbi:MAG TPA: hypothetical protein DCZ71_02155 [Ruminococcus sp.]|nr:hypothetical protein [Ruminococcus sp.]